LSVKLDFQNFFNNFFNKSVQIKIRNVHTNDKQSNEVTIKKLIFLKKLRDQFYMALMARLRYLI